MPDVGEMSRPAPWNDEQGVDAQVVAVQMDPLESINIAGDSSFALILSAQQRGHRLFHYTADAHN